MQADTQERARLPVGGSFVEVLAVFTRLGLTSFGGPIAHLGYFRAEFVERRRWVDDETYADLVALCQFLPGPASSQTAMAIGLLRAGLPGVLAAWIGFTMPSALLMLAFALGVGALGDAGASGWLHGLKVVAVAVVAQAVWGMARTLCPDRTRASVALMAAAVLLAWPTALGQLLVIAAGGLFGWLKLRPAELAPPSRLRVQVPRSLAITAWLLFFGLLALLPLLRELGAGQTVALADSFYRAGALVFGGGHVVLPLLQAEVVPTGWVSADRFIAGYAAAQALPGPLFAFAAYLGAVSSLPPTGLAGGLIALVAIFLPAVLLVLGALPFWETLRARPDAQGTLRGVNAAVVGVLLAALYTPIWTSAILGPLDLSLALICFGLLHFWKLPPWMVVLAAMLAGQALRQI